MIFSRYCQNLQQGRRRGSFRRTAAAAGHCQALVTKPKILVLDEPTEGIQPSIIQDIGKAIRRVNKELGITVLIVEQYLEFVLEISDYIYMMEKGNIVMQGKTGDWMPCRYRKP